MTPGQYQRLCELFDQAQALAPAERAAFVQQACADDASLRAELERLLTHDRQAGGEPLWRGPCPVNAKGLLAADQPAAVPAPPPGAAPPEPVTLPLPAGKGQEPASDVPTVLRRRLRWISLVVFAVYALFVIPFAFSLYRGISLQPQDLARCPPFLLAFLVGALAPVILWTRRRLSLRQLRAIELTVFGAVMLGPAWELFCDLFFFPQFAGMAEVVHIGQPDTFRNPETAAVAEWIWWLHSSYSSLPFFILIVCYATLIPSGWRRCTLVVGATALTPLLISLAACFLTAGSPSVFFMGYVVPMGITLAIAVAIAAYGTHRIELLRREAAAARKLGQYQLRKRLGAGGMGEVYLAEHTLLKQPCAVKLIRPDQAGDPATLRRFEREVQATARLKHWNTVQIYDYGHAPDGTFYYVMEYLPGTTLEQLVRRHGPLPPARAVHLLRQACGALREAHAGGLIHRDIKPANIMVCARGGAHDVAKLLDFGLVKAVGPAAAETTLTQEGAIAGTPAYLSPEQASGKSDLDGRSDIYSLGAVAYFLLTGQPPFLREQPLQMIIAHVVDPVRRLTDLRPDFPTDLQAVVLRCLEKEPGKRFGDVGGLEQALAACGCAGQWDEERAAGWWRDHGGTAAERLATDCSQSKHGGAR
jgi:serine/threonine-protein kinase